MSRFVNRRIAGKALAAEISSNHRDLVDQPDTLVLGLPRGGIPVAFEVARSIHAPLDAYVVRKLGVPGQEELAMGALAMDGTAFRDETLIKWLGITAPEFENILQQEQKELERRAVLYRGSKTAPPVRGKKVLIVDDGLATGATMRAAVQALRREQPALLIIAIPVAPPSTVKELSPDVDRMICLEEHEPFIGVGLWYKDFSQTTDFEVEDLLMEAHSWTTEPAASGKSPLPQEGSSTREKREAAATQSL